MRRLKFNVEQRKVGKEVKCHLNDFSTYSGNLNTARLRSRYQGPYVLKGLTDKISDHCQHERNEGGRNKG